MLSWNVYYENFNQRKIETYNVLQHGGFVKDLKDFLKKHPNTDKESFAKCIKSNLMYYFWSRCEWEVLVCPLFSSNTREEKIDVYDQISMNFDIFVDYCWNNKNEIKKLE